MQAIFSAIASHVEIPDPSTRLKNFIHIYCDNDEHWIKAPDQATGVYYWFNKDIHFALPIDQFPPCQDPNMVVEACKYNTIVYNF